MLHTFSTFVERIGLQVSLTGRPRLHAIAAPSESDQTTRAFRCAQPASIADDTDAAINAPPEKPTKCRERPEHRAGKKTGKQNVEKRRKRNRNRAEGKLNCSGSVPVAISVSSSPHYASASSTSTSSSRRVRMRLNSLAARGRQSRCPIIAAATLLPVPQCGGGEPSSVDKRCGKKNERTGGDDPDVVGGVEVAAPAAVADGAAAQVVLVQSSPSRGLKRLCTSLRSQNQRRAEFFTTLSLRRMRRVDISPVAQRLCPLMGPLEEHENFATSIVPRPSHLGTILFTSAFSVRFPKMRSGKSQHQGAAAADCGHHAAHERHATRECLALAFDRRDFERQRGGVQTKPRRGNVGVGGGVGEVASRARAAPKAPGARSRFARRPPLAPLPPRCLKFPRLFSSPP